MTATRERQQYAFTVAGTVKAFSLDHAYDAVATELHEHLTLAGPLDVRVDDAVDKPDVYTLIQASHRNYNAHDPAGLHDFRNAVEDLIRSTCPLTDTLTPQQQARRAADRLWEAYELLHDAAYGLEIAAGDAPAE